MYTAEVIITLDNITSDKILGEIVTICLMQS